MKGKERAVDVDDDERMTTANTKTVEDERRFVLFIEHAERLKDSMPDLLVPLTRLAEIVSPLLRFALARSRRTDNVECRQGWMSQSLCTRMCVGS